MECTLATLQNSLAKILQELLLKLVSQDAIPCHTFNTKVQTCSKQIRTVGTAGTAGTSLKNWHPHHFRSDCREVLHLIYNSFQPPLMAYQLASVRVGRLP